MQQISTLKEAAAFISSAFVVVLSHRPNVSQKYRKEAQIYLYFESRTFYTI